MEITNILEELGTVIVDDDLYIGRRYFTTMVNEALSPIEALADRYSRDIPCCTKYSGAIQWADYLISLMHESEAKGIVHLMVKYCEPHAFDYPLLRMRLSQAGIPHILIETEQTVPSGQIRTKLQAFIENL
jgi:benzoyl-CoA reductase/2-hydroxyglutaryl-CoA dehydratase subunit BcrC/BadD/HgdB